MTTTSDTHTLPKEVLSVELPPKGENGEDCLFFKVGVETTIGFPGPYKFENRRMVTKIELRDDVPGLVATTWRICVFVGDHMVAEMPYHAVESIVYAIPEEKEGQSDEVG